MRPSQRGSAYQPIFAGHFYRLGPAVDAYAARSPNVTVATFDGDHFDVYSPPASDRAGTAGTDSSPVTCSAIIRARKTMGA